MTAVTSRASAWRCRRRRSMTLARAAVGEDRTLARDAAPLQADRARDRPVPEHDGHRWGIPRWVERMAGVVLVLALWQLAATMGWISTRTPSPARLTRSHALAKDGRRHAAAALWVSLQRVCWGSPSASRRHVAGGRRPGCSGSGEDLVDAHVQMLRFVPIIGLQPLFVLWLGIGETAKISLIVLGVCSRSTSTRSPPSARIDPGFPSWPTPSGSAAAARIRRVVLPGALPGFLVGLRLATAVAWLLLVFAEQINAISGIGYLMVQARTFFQTDVIVVASSSTPCSGCSPTRCPRARRGRCAGSPER